MDHEHRQLEAPGPIRIARRTPSPSARSDTRTSSRVRSSTQPVFSSGTVPGGSSALGMRRQVDRGAAGRSPRRRSVDSQVGVGEHALAQPDLAAGRPCRRTVLRSSAPTSCPPSRPPAGCRPSRCPSRAASATASRPPARRPRPASRPRSCSRPGALLLRERDAAARLVHDLAGVPRGQIGELSADRSAALQAATAARRAAAAATRWASVRSAWREPSATVVTTPEPRLSTRSRAHWRDRPHVSAEGRWSKADAGRPGERCRSQGLPSPRPSPASGRGR